MFKILVNSQLFCVKCGTNKSLKNIPYTVIHSLEKKAKYNRNRIEKEFNNSN
jgi:hypothetical protein